MKRKIYLEGELGHLFGTEFSFVGDTVKDAVSCIAANRPKFRQYLISAHEREIDFSVQVQGSEIEKIEHCLLPLGEGDIIITPVAAGSKSGGAKILGAVALSFLSFGLSNFIYAQQIAMLSGGGLPGVFLKAAAWGIKVANVMAVNLALTGIQQLMAPDPATDSDEPESYLFNGSERTVVEGDPIPLLYGELRVPGYPVSFEIVNNNYSASNSYLDSNNNIITDAQIALNPVEYEEYINNFYTPNQQSMLGYARSQTLMFTDVISEGPIFGLVGGVKSVFLNDDPAVGSTDTPLKLAESGIEFTLTNGSTSVTASSSINTSVPQEGSKYLIVRDYATRSSGVSAEKITINTNSIGVRVTTSSTFFGVGLDRVLSDPAQNAVLRLYKNDVLYFEGFIQTKISDTVAECVPINPSSLFPGFTDGSYDSVSIDGSLAISSINGTSITLASTFPAATGNYNCDISGSIYNPLSSTDAVNENQKYKNYTVQFRTGELNQPIFNDLGGTGEGSISIAASVNEAIQGPGQTTTNIREYFGNSDFSLTGSQIEEVDEIRILFNYSSLINNNETGGDAPGKVWYTLEIATKVDSTWGDYISLGERRHRATSKSPVSFEEIIDLTSYKPFADFKIKITRLTKDDVAYEEVRTASNSKYTSATPCTIATLTSIIKEPLSYPLTAMSKVTVSSKNFSGVPSRTYHCRGLKVQVPSNYVTREEASDGVAKYTRNLSTGAIGASYVDWDGNFRVNKVYTNNPAWVFYDILTNNRYGLGNWLEVSDIDKYSLYRIARYCDELVPNGNGGYEPRFTANIYLTKSTDAYKILKDFATVFRGMLYWLDGQMVPIIDQACDPVYNFTAGNVIDGQFGYESTGSKTRSNQVIVTWNNPDANFKQEALIVEDRENIIKTGKIISEEAVAFGATSEGQALRYGRWKLWTARNQTEVVSFKTAINAAFLMPGDIINIQDSSRYPTAVQYSGRVSSTGTRNTTTIPLDRAIELTSGSAYELGVLIEEPGAFLVQESATISSVSYSRGDLIPSVTSEEDTNNLVDDSGDPVLATWKEYTRVETRTVSTSSGTGITSLTVSSAFSTTPNAQTVWVLKELLNGDTVQGSTKQYKILTLAENGKNEYSITAVEHYNEKFDSIDEDFIIATQDPIRPPPKPTDEVPAPLNLYASIQNLDSGDIDNDVTIYWDIPKLNGKNYEFISGYEIEHTIPNYPSPIRVDKSITSRTGMNIPTGTYTVGVKTVSSYGKFSVPTKTTFTIGNPAGQSVPRKFGMALGGVISSGAFITAEGVFTIEDKEYAISPIGDPGLVLPFDGNPSTEYLHDCSGIPSVNFSALTTSFDKQLASHYIMLDGSNSDPLTLIKYYQDNDLGYGYFYNAGNGSSTYASNWTNIGSVTVSASSNKVVGTGFTSSLQVGDLIKFSSTQAAKVVYIASDTDARIDRSFTTSISATAYRSSFRFDKNEDSIIYQIRNDNGEFKAYPINLVVNPDLGKVPRTALISIQPAIINFNADETVKTTYDNIVIKATGIGYKNPLFKVTGAGFDNAEISQSEETEYSAPTEGSSTYVLTLDPIETYTSTYPIFTVTIIEELDETNTDKTYSDSFTIPLVLDGASGTAGNSGLTLYKVNNNENTAPTLPSGPATYNFSTGELTEDTAGNLQGWTSTAPSTTSSNQYLWVTQAVALGSSGGVTDTIESGDWSAAAIAGRYGVDGISFKSEIVELWQVTATGTAPSVPSNTITWDFTTHSIASGTLNNGWSRVSPDVDSTNKYLWKTAAFATASDSDTSDNITSDDWSDPAIVGAYGDSGSTGQSVDIIFKRSATQPATPVPSSGTPSGWYSDVDSVPSGSDPIWASTGIKAVGVTTFTWQVPVKVEGTDGTDGTNGASVAELSIFKRATSTPTTPTGGSFTFPASLTAPSGWYTTAPSGTDPIYLSRAFASSTTPTGTDSDITWSTPVLFVQNGTDGTPGAPGAVGLRTATGYVYSTSSTAPSSNTYYWSFTNKAFTSALPNGWSLSPPTYDVSSGNSYYYSVWTAEESSSGSGVSSGVTFGAAGQNIVFSGLVTFTGSQLTDGTTTSTFADSGDIPTNVSDLSNDSGFQTATNVSSLITTNNQNYFWRSGTTQIDGANIYTGSITLEKLQSTSYSYIKDSAGNPTNHRFALSAYGISIAGTEYDATLAAETLDTTGTCVAGVFINNTTNSNNHALAAGSKGGPAALFFYDSDGSWSTSSSDSWVKLAESARLIAAGSNSTSEKFFVATNGDVGATGIISTSSTTASNSTGSGALIVGGGAGIAGNINLGGNLTATGNVTAYSDVRLKENLKVIPNALEKVQQLTGYTFDRTDLNIRQTGLIAQDVQKVLPEAVNEGEYLGLNYGSLVGLLVEAIKDLKAEIEELKRGTSK